MSHDGCGASSSRNVTGVEEVHKARGYWQSELNGRTACGDVVEPPSRRGILLFLVVVCRSIARGRRNGKVGCRLRHRSRRAKVEQRSRPRHG